MEENKGVYFAECPHCGREMIVNVGADTAPCDDCLGRVNGPVTVVTVISQGEWEMAALETAEEQHV